MIISILRKPGIANFGRLAIEHECGSLNIGASRIRGGKDYKDKCESVVGCASTLKSSSIGKMKELRESSYSESGRWPANLFLHHKKGCFQSGFVSMPAPVINRFNSGMKPFGHGAGHSYQSVQTSDDGQELVPTWTCEKSCAGTRLNKQSGFKRSAVTKRPVEGYESQSNTSFLKGRSNHQNQHGDAGGASRFFFQMKTQEEIIQYLDAMVRPPDGEVLYIEDCSRVDWKSLQDETFAAILLEGEFENFKEELNRVLKPGGYLVKMPSQDDPFGAHGTASLEDFGFEVRDTINVLDEFSEFFYVAKTKTSERNAGVEGRSSHPTVKPKELMELLLEDLPEGATILDPFMGSGSTGIAALRREKNFIGIEQDKEYIRIATQRIRYWDNEHAPWDPSMIISDADKFEEESQEHPLWKLFK